MTTNGATVIDVLRFGVQRRVEKRTSQEEFSINSSRLETLATDDAVALAKGSIRPEGHDKAHEQQQCCPK